MSRSMPPLELEPSAAYTAALYPSGPLVAGAYQVGGVIGVGTYGEVRYAVSILTGERVAIKIVDLARFTRETAGLMRKEIAILRMLGGHPHCIRIIEVHENVPFKGKWCEACACTSFKTNDGDSAAAAAAHHQQHPHAAQAPFPGTGTHQQHHHQQQQQQQRRIPSITSNSVCAVCSHSAAEHSGVTYAHMHTDPYATADEEDEGETRQVMLIVQELAAGGELFSLLQHSGPLPEDVARLYFRQLIEGMEHLHSLNITHRDLKPENLCLTEDFSLKIADFGLASLGTPVPPHDPANTTLAFSQQQHQHAAHPDKHAAQSALPDVRHYSGVGSQPYSAPECYYIRELYGGRGYRGAPCDLWSAAVILFVMLTGRPPFVRPLAKTYGAHMRRCRHFVGILAGTGLDILHPHAKDLLQNLLKLAPGDRLSVAQVKQHPWYLGATPSHEELVKIMNERAMISWAHSNHDMTHVLSKMRSSKEVPPPSNEGTPHFNAQSMSASPMFDPHTALNSPSFSASSIPPSPFAFGATQQQQQQQHGRPRAHSPDSREQSQYRYSNASPASFAHGQSAFLSPNSAHAQAAAAVAAAAAAATAAPHPVQQTRSRGESQLVSPLPSIASSIAAPSASLPPPPPPSTAALLQVSLLQMSLQDGENVDGHSEIPPSGPAQQQQQQQPLPSTTTTTIITPAAVAPVQPPQIPRSAAHGHKQDEHARKKMAAVAAAEQMEAEKKAAAAAATVSSKRTYTLARFASSPAIGLPPPLAAAASALLLSSSFSYPPRVAYASFTSSLEFDTLRELLQARLEKRGAKFRQLPPRGGGKVKLQSHALHPHPHPHPLPSPQQQQQQQQSAAAAAASGMGGVGSPLGMVAIGEETLMHVTASFQGNAIVALLSIRTIRMQQGGGGNGGGGGGAAAATMGGSVGPKGRLVLAEKIRAADPFAFQAWFDSIAAGLRED